MPAESPRTVTIPATVNPQDSEQLARELAVRKGLLEALLVFSRGVSARSSLPAALESLAVEVARLVGTRRASIWLHDRRTRTLTLTGSSDPQDAGARQSMGVDDDSPIAAAMRRDTPEATGTGAAQCLAAPLRGWRRALGALVLEGEPRDLPLDRYVDVVRDFAPQLSVAIENLLALDAVIEQHAHRTSTGARLDPTGKLAALGQYMAGIAHDLNNPLQSVLGHLELLMNGAPAGSTLRADLKRIYADADRAAKIVRNLLVFAGSRRPSRRRIDPGRLIARTVADRERTPDRPVIAIEQVVSPALPAVVGDAELLQQALTNVLVTAEHAAARANRSSGIVRVTASGDRTVRIIVEDNGPGLDAQSVHRVFEPFALEEPGKGTGIGLAIAAGIVQELGGHITASASPLGGAMIVIELPAAD